MKSKVWNCETIDEERRIYLFSTITYKNVYTYVHFVFLGFLYSHWRTDSDGVLKTRVAQINHCRLRIHTLQVMHVPIRWFYHVHLNSTIVLEIKMIEMKIMWITECYMYMYMICDQFTPTLTEAYVYNSVTGKKFLETFVRYLKSSKNNHQSSITLII